MKLHRRVESSNGRKQDRIPWRLDISGGRDETSGDLDDYLQLAMMRLRCGGGRSPE